MSGINLCALNQDLEAGHEIKFPDHFIVYWLWHCDPQETFQYLNEGQLAGLLLARFKARFRASHAESQRLFPNMVHSDTNVKTMRLRQVRDQLDDLQIHWRTYSENHESIERCHQLLEALFTRFGMLCDMEHMDLDSENIDANRRISLQSLRHFLNVFMILYRHVWLHSEAQDAEHLAPQSCDVTICPHHVEASLEMFDTHAMIVNLPPAARLLYKQDFAGMYHCLSQVIYFHFPDYEPPLPLDLTSLQQARSWHSLAPIFELHPSVPIIMDDEKPQPVCWFLLSGGRVFLWKHGKVYTHRNLLTVANMLEN